MKKELYVIYDSKSAVYGNPFAQLNDQVALRMAADLAQDMDTEVGRHPTDFTMFKIGSYEDTTGQVTQLKTHEVICRFHEIQNQLPFDQLGEEHINSNGIKEAS